MPEACNFFKKETLAQAFSVNFVKFLGTTYLQNTSGRLLLAYVVSTHFHSFVKNNFCCILNLLSREAYNIEKTKVTSDLPFKLISRKVARENNLGLCELVEICFA